jgi:prepilin peptidase CpaA
MDITAQQAIWLLPPVLPVALWIAYSDLKFMKITNNAVLILAGIFVVVGLIAFPMEEWLWRLAHLLIVLAIGFVASSLGLIGGGDAKYAAAIAPFVAYSDLRRALVLFGIMLLSALIIHKVAARIPAIRSRTPDWKSWTSGKDFPMGLALSGTLITYLVAGLFSG